MIDFIVPKEHLLYGTPLMVSLPGDDHFRGSILGHMMYHFGCREYEAMANAHTIRYCPPLTQFSRTKLPLYWIYRSVALYNEIPNNLRLSDRDYILLWAISRGRKLGRNEFYRYEGKKQSILDAREVLSRHGINFEVE